MAWLPEFILLTENHRLSLKLKQNNRLSLASKVCPCVSVIVPGTALTNSINVKFSKRADLHL